MELQLDTSDSKDIVFAKIKDYLSGLSLNETSVDSSRPWGGFYVIDEAQTALFISTFFPDLQTEQIIRGGKLSPKILIVEPDKRLSWQYHNRREELWCVISGPVGVITGETDQQGAVQEVHAGDVVQFGTNIRHRLVGLKTWGIVAEIWQHTDLDNPSDESDIVRVADDFGR